MNIPFRSKETSWLSFNARVLQEAADPSVPLMERLKFLGIYSSNLDEFFRVRVATLRRLVSLGDHWESLDMPDPSETLKEVASLVAKQSKEFNTAYHQAFADLEENGIRLVNDEEVPKALHDHLREYFTSVVRPHIFPIMLKASAKLPQLRDLPMYLAVRLSKSDGRGRAAYSLIEIPSSLPRFIPLPEGDGDTRLVMYLDDIIRFGLSEIFSTLPYDVFESYAIKFTRDSELEFDDDFTESFYEKLEEGLKARDEGSPVRANFDADFPAPFLSLILKKLNLHSKETLYPGARYHNRRDLLTFPKLGRDDLTYEKSDPIVPKSLKKRLKKGYFTLIRKKDHLLHFPYHSFQHFIEFLQEASIDTRVQSIEVTQY
ncbi:MAG: polyphosphate kinase 1, partial [Verrucomicrobiales bacterium]|nr:polyphosphate kinase 1 [Verrucomicrobiales bacterium]